MKCACCGQELSSRDRFCPNCGENNEGFVQINETPVRETPKPINNSQPINRVPIYTNDNQSSQNSSIFYHQTNISIQPQTEGAAIAVLALVFSILGGWLGLVFAIIGLSKYTTKKYRVMCGVSLGLIIAWFITGFILGLCLY